MAAANKIYPFAPTVGPDNLYTNAEYLALSDRTNGNQPGTADDRLNNKALRQATIMAAGLAQFLADGQGTDVEDSLDEATIAAMLEAVVLATVPQASTTVQGKVELATNAETQTGTDSQRAVTPSGLSSRSATLTRTGLVELATTAETQTGTDADRAVTPAGLAGAFTSASASTKLPGGLIVKTGTATSGAHVATTFAAAFPNACFTVQAITDNRTDNLGLEALSASGFTLDCNNSGHVVRWLAVGN
jgi:hypothetical protein